jgi:mono/diheme cytochrome c family protein
MRAMPFLLGAFVAFAALAAAGPAWPAGLSSAGQVPHRPNAESKPITTSVRSLFVVHCAGCHGMDGAGSPTAYVPDVRKLGAFLRLNGGREYVISVPGVMGSGLDDRQVADVTNWLLATLAASSLPPQFTPYDASEVQRARQTPLVDVASARLGQQAQARERGIPIE